MSIAEQPSGDLIVNLYAKQYDGTNPKPFDDGSNDLGQEVKEWRYTVHTSAKSENGINIINNHRTLEGDEYRKGVTVTTAIKKEKRFVPLHARLFSSMKHHSYDLKSGTGRIINLGQYSDLFTLFFSVFVGPKNILFNRKIKYANSRIVRFENFTILLIWTYLGIPAANHTRYFLLKSREGGEPFGGFNSKNVIDYFIEVRDVARNTIIDVKLKSAEENIDYKTANVLINSRFFSSVSLTSKEFIMLSQKYSRKLNKK